eukprot:2561031-Pleurochrysis_carterae.AAC.2
MLHEALVEDKPLRVDIDCERALPEKGEPHKQDMWRVAQTIPSRAQLAHELGDLVSRLALAQIGSLVRIASSGESGGEPWDSNW